MAAKRKRRTSNHSGTLIGIGALALAASIFSRHMHSSETLLLGTGIGMILGMIIGFRTARRHAPPAVPVRTPREETEPRKTRLPVKNISAACAADECAYCTDKGCQHCNHPERTYRERNKKPLYEVPDEPPF